MNKKLFTFKNLLLGSALAFMTSCSDDKETCAECHVVVAETEIELKEFQEYCGDELHDLEENGYTFDNTIYVDSHGDSLDTPIEPGYVGAVSYTHLTLPTILLV